MRKLTTNTFVSLDGVMQAPGGPPEDPSGGFSYGGWSVTYWDDMMGQIMGDSFARPFDMLLGRKTYEIFAAYWPYAGDQPGAAELNRARKYVASRTLKTVEWANSTLIKGDVVREVRALKQADGPEIQIHGSGNLIQSLLKAGAIDEFRLWIFPVLLGRGKRLFGDGTIGAGLQLRDSKTSTTGVTVATYEPKGPVPIGTFETDKPSEAELARRKRWAQEG
ncbi:MAG: dihydrofolate reductase family protein [bacterium]